MHKLSRQTFDEKIRNEQSTRLMRATSFMKVQHTSSPATLSNWIALAALGLTAMVSPAQAIPAKDLILHNTQESVIVHPADGSYEIVERGRLHPEIRAGVAAMVDHHWIRCGDYPGHKTQQSSFTDALGNGEQITVTCSGLVSQPDLLYVIRLYSSFSAGEIRVEVQNRSSRSITIQRIRPVEGIGDRPIETGNSESSDRILSDSFSEDWPPLKIYDFSQAPQGMLRAVGSQLIYNRESRDSLFFGALTSERFLTILHLRTDQRRSAIDSYNVDSTGTTEIQASDPESGLKKGPAKNLIELSVLDLPGATVSSERLLFAAGDNYYSILNDYGSAIRILHHPRIDSGPMLGWWSWTAFYSSITQGNVWTNAQWLAQHLKDAGYDYFHLDLGYAYARGEYTTPNRAQFPDGLASLGRRVCSLGLKMGYWTAPFEVSDRSWVYQNHKDWLVHNGQGEPIQIGVGEEAGRELLYVLDATHPAAQQYLQTTYQTLAGEWGGRYIKLDFMDNTAIEGHYFRPNTTALEAQRIGLQIIRKAVGENVLLDKDGSPMLNPVGLVDEGRLSQDTGHTFLRSKEAAPGIAARYYMNRNFFMADPDAFTISKQLIEERKIQSPLTRNEAEVSVTLAAVSGGMFEIGDNLPTLGADPERLALLTNADLLQMVRLGRAALPLDLLTYRPQDEQPGVFLLHEDRRQAMLAVFNWTEEARSQDFALSDLMLQRDHSYQLIDVFHSAASSAIKGGVLRVQDQPRHSVYLFKIIDESIPAAPPSIQAKTPEKGLAGEDLRFSAVAAGNGVPALAYHWNFGDGVSTDGAAVTHNYTGTGMFNVQLAVDGVDGVAYRKTFPLLIQGTARLPAPRR
jgi:alpha-galactosidase